MAAPAAPANATATDPKEEQRPLDKIAKSNLTFFLSLLLPSSLFAGSLWYTIKYIGSQDTWKDIQASSINSLVMSLSGAFLFYIACAWYFWDKPEMSNYFLIAMSFVTLALSFSALSIAVITKV